MGTIDFNNMTAADRSAAIAQLRDIEAAETAKRDNEIMAYKKMVSDTVKEQFPRLQAISLDLCDHKRSIREAFAAVLELKAELYSTKDGQQSHTFMDESGNYRIIYGYYVKDNYDDTVDAGIEKVKDYINSLARDSESRILVDTILKLLSKDAKGTLKASRVLQLQQMADRSGSDDFRQGVKIIRDAYQPVESKRFIRAEYKNGVGVWVSVPLGMTEAE